MKILFWLFVAIDLLAIGVFGLLGLAAAGSSRTNPLLALLIPFFIPGAILAGAIWLFLSSQAVAARALALLIAALPFLLVVGSQAVTFWELLSYRDGGGNIRQFRSDSLREIEAAIERNDAAAVAAAARGADLNTPGLSGATVLVLALRHLREAPGKLDVVRALLAAGADPNATGVEPPLQIAIGESRASGKEPVQLLLDAGANPNARGEGGEPVFFIAGGAGIDPAVMELLLARGADLKLLDEKGRSAVVLPAMTNNWRVLELLLRRGAPWKDQPGAVGVPFLEYVEREAQESPRRGASTDGLAEVLALLRAEAGKKPR